MYNANVINAFSTHYNNNINNNVQKILSLSSLQLLSSSLFMSSFSADGSEYSTKDSDYESDGDDEDFVCVMAILTVRINKIMHQVKLTNSLSLNNQALTYYKR